MPPSRSGSGGGMGGLSLADWVDQALAQGIQRQAFCNLPLALVRLQTKQHPHHLQLLLRTHSSEPTTLKEMMEG